MEHRWSGWPGAWCLDCGAEDQREVCLAHGCGVVHEFDEVDGAMFVWPPICENRPCPAPGSDRHNPYVRRA